MKKMQKNLDDRKEILKIKERQLTMAKDISSQYQKDYQTNCNEIKVLREKVKGNMSLIHAREINQNNIIQEVKSIQDYMLIIVEEKMIIRDLESIIASHKEKKEDDRFS